MGLFRYKITWSIYFTDTLLPYIIICFHLSCCQHCCKISGSSPMSKNAIIICCISDNRSELFYHISLHRHVYGPHLVNSSTIIKKSSAELYKHCYREWRGDLVPYISGMMYMDRLIKDSFYEGI